MPALHTLAMGEFPFHISGFGSPLEFLALIVELAAPGKGDFQLYFAMLEVKLGRNNGESLLFYACCQKVYFPVMEQEFPVSVGFLKYIAAPIVRSYAHADNVDLALSTFNEAVAKAYLACTQAFHFWPGKDYASLEKFQEFIILACLSVIDARRIGHERMLLCSETAETWFCLPR